jgi:hypothetical protein
LNFTFCGGLPDGENLRAADENANSGLSECDEPERADGAATLGFRRDQLLEFFGHLFLAEDALAEKDTKNGFEDLRRGRRDLSCPTARMAIGGSRASYRLNGRFRAFLFTRSGGRAARSRAAFQNLPSDRRERDAHSHPRLRDDYSSAGVNSARRGIGRQFDG